MKKPHDKTPWNPSAKAIARVKDALPAPTVCEHCSSAVEIMHHDKIYGRVFNDWPWVYACTGKGCGARVGMHPFTPIPLGTLATPAMRDTRNHCKPPFESLYQSGKLSRDEAYARLAAKLGLPLEKCHFAMFDVEMCHRARDAAFEIAQEVA